MLICFLKENRVTKTNNDCWQFNITLAVSFSPRPMYLLYPKSQHGGDRERLRPQGPKIFLMTGRPLSWSCGHRTEMLLLLKNYFRPDYGPIFSDMTVKRNVSRFFTRLICDWNLFQPLGLASPDLKIWFIEWQVTRAGCKP